MEPRVPKGIREFERWLDASLAEAEPVVPALVALPAPLLRRELRTRPELRTAGVLRRLIGAARDSLYRFPSRAHEITAIVARYAPSMSVPGQFAFVRRTLQGEAWREHATALREIGRTEKAGQAIRLARRFFEGAPGGPWRTATVDLVEAPLLHDRGRPEEALRLVRQAARQFDLARDHDRLIEARLLESWMLWAAGRHDAAHEVWTEADRLARGRGDQLLVARIAAKMGLFELRYGSIAEASRLLAEALKHFDRAGCAEDALRTRGCSATIRPAA